MSSWRISAVMALSASITLTAPAASQNATLPHPPCGYATVDLENGVPSSLTTALSHSEHADAAALAIVALHTWIDQCSDAGGRAAIQALRKVSSKYSDDDGLREALAIVMAHGPEVIVAGGEGIVLRPAHKFSNSEKEALELLTSLASKHAWPEAADEALRLGLATRREKTIEDAARAALPLAADHADVAATLALADIAINKYQDAEQIADASVKQNDAAALRASGIAHMMSDTTPTAGAAAYMKGIDVADVHAMALYYDDIRLILEEPELNAWRDLKQQDRAAWLKKAWQWRASTATISLPDRLAEHFRRTAYALANYSRQSYRGGDPFDALWSREFTHVEPLDDRGIVYVRHGPPDAIVRFQTPKNPSRIFYRMAWLYRGLAGGRAVLEFEKDPTRPDYYLPDPSTVNGCTVNTRFRTDDTSEEMQEYVASIANWLNWEGSGLDSHIKRPNATCYMTTAGDVNIEHDLSGVDLRRTVGNAIYETETAVPRMKKPIHTLLNTYAFRGNEDGTADIWTVTSVQASELIGATTGKGTDYSMHFFADVENPATRDVTRVDPDYHHTFPAKFTAGDILHLSANIDAPATDNATIRIGIRNQIDTLQGDMLTTSRSIPDFKPKTLAMSDLVVAETEDGLWKRNGVPLTPIAGHRIGEQQSFKLYYEVYGVTNGEPLSVDIMVTPIHEKDVISKLRNLIKSKEATELQFPETVSTTDGDLYASSRSIQPNVKPGSYLMTVTITRTRTGQKTSNATALTVYPAGT